MMPGKSDQVGAESPASVLTKIQGIQTQAQMRQALYKLCSTLFLYPSEDIIISLKTYAEELKTNSSIWKQYFFADKLMHLIEQVLTINPSDRKPIVDEYNRLFFIKPAVSPYETSYPSKSSQSQPLIAAELSGIYSQAGLEVSPELNDFPDHIAIELEFMSFLCSNEIEASREKDLKKLSASRKDQIGFLSKHLALWYPEFARRSIEESNPELIYRSLVESTFGFIHNELSILGIKAKGD